MPAQHSTIATQLVQTRRSAEARPGISIANFANRRRPRPVHRRSAASLGMMALDNERPPRRRIMKSTEYDGRNAHGNIAIDKEAAGETLAGQLLRASMRASCAHITQA